MSEAIGFLSLTWCVSETGKNGPEKLLNNLLQFARNQLNDHTIEVHAAYIHIKEFDGTVVRVGNRSVTLKYSESIVRDDTIELYLIKPDPKKE